MPPKKKTGNEALMAAIRDSNRWGNLDERVDYQTRLGKFANAQAGAESNLAWRDQQDRRVIASKPPTKPKGRVRPGKVAPTSGFRRYGSIAWAEGHIYPLQDVDPEPFLDREVPKGFRPRDRRLTGAVTMHNNERLPRNSHGPRVDLDRLAEPNIRMDEMHSLTGDGVLRGIPRVQQANMDLPHTRSAAVNSVLHYVLDSHAPKTSR